MILSPINAASSFSCGDGVEVCGVLVLESGLGSGTYHHDHPTVHGLWPQVSPYGDSECIAPEDKTSPSKGMYTHRDIIFPSNPHIHSESFMFFSYMCSLSVLRAF